MGKKLFVSERFNRLKVGSPVGGVDAEEQTHCRGEECGQQDGVPAHHRVEGRAAGCCDLANDESDQPAQPNADDAAQQTQ